MEVWDQNELNHINFLKYVGPSEHNSSFDEPRSDN